MYASPRAEMQAGEEDSTDDSSSESDVGESDIFGNAHAGNGFYINKTVYNKLHDYQRKALVWFWGLYQNGKGGILGDDMGLGKTVQVIAFLRGLTETKPKIQLKVLIVLPVTLLQNWEREFSEWAPSIAVHKLHGVGRNEKEGLLNRVQRKGGVVLTSYGVVRMDWNLLSTFVWDFMICDEGHKIKNPAAQMTKAAHAIRARQRFILTGTPIQNNLMEFWALFSFVDGTILGQRQTFRKEYELPITNARKKEASEETKAKGDALSESLRKLTDPYVLHRKKADVLKKMGKKVEGKWKSEDMPSCSYDWKIKSQLLGNEITPLAHKNDLVMWLPPSDIQIDFYNKYVDLDIFKVVMRENVKTHVFVKLMILKALCDHPRLLSKMACQDLGLHVVGCGNKNDDSEDLECAANDITRVSEEVLQEESGKLKFLFKLLDDLREKGHRCLVFSRSLKMLNIIEKILRTKQFRWKRLDGTINNMDEREEIITDFQEDDSYHVFLLTTQVGGTGLNLTGADRVVIVDPSWNPSTDNQAVDRAYRIGQTRSVIVYRLITCGTIEEKIYRRQVFKQSIIKQTMDNTDEETFRYFTSQELRDLFVLEDTNESVTQKQLENLHGGQRQSDRELDAHIAFLKSIVSGISDHDLLFSLDSKTMRAKIEDCDAEVRRAEGQLAEDNICGLFAHAKNDDRMGGSTREEMKWHLSLLHGEDKKALQKVPMVARQIAANSGFDDAIGPFRVAVKEEFPRPVCSIKTEQKPCLLQLHESQSLVKQRLGGVTWTTDPQATDEVWIIDDSSSSDDDHPKTSGVKKEGTLKNYAQVRSDYVTDESRTLDKIGEHSKDRKLEMVEWKSSDKEHGNFQDKVQKKELRSSQKELNLQEDLQLQSDSIYDASKTFKENDADSTDDSLEIIEWRSCQEEPGDDIKRHVKKEEILMEDHQLQFSSIRDSSKTFKKMDVDSMDVSLQTIQLRSAQKEHVGFQDDDKVSNVKKVENMKSTRLSKCDFTSDIPKTFQKMDEDKVLDIVEWRSQKEPDSLHGNDLLDNVKKEDGLTNTHQLNSDSVSDQSRALKKVDNLPCFPGNPGQGECRSSKKEQDSLHDDDNAENVTEEGTKKFQQEEADDSPPTKRAAYQGYQFKWLD